MDPKPRAPDGRAVGFAEPQRTPEGRSPRYTRATVPTSGRASWVTQSIGTRGQRGKPLALLRCDSRSSRAANTPPTWRVLRAKGRPSQAASSCCASGREAYHGAMGRVQQPGVKAPRRKPGRGSQVTPDERLAIQRAHLIDGQNQQQLADRFGRTRETIGHVLKNEGFLAVKREVYEALAEEARGVLKGHVRTAAKDWRTASGIAAKKGDHRPAKDLLLHAGAIERVGETSGPQVIVCVGMPGSPAMKAPTQADIEAAEREQAAEGETIDVVAQPERLNAGDSNTDTSTH